MKIYVAGKMRGEEAFNFERFFYWAHVLKQDGHTVINPAQIDVEKFLKGWQWDDSQYTEVLLEDLRLITTVDAIFLLKGWQDSPGAVAEVTFANALGKKIMEEPDEQIPEAQGTEERSHI